MKNDNLTLGYKKGDVVTPHEDMDEFKGHLTPGRPYRVTEIYIKGNLGDSIPFLEVECDDGKRRDFMYDRFIRI